jgi:hypothetical protein
MNARTHEPGAVQARDQEHDAERTDTHALEHAERTGHIAQHFLRVDGIAEHAEAHEGRGEVDLLATVEHGGRL